MTKARGDRSHYLYFFSHEKWLRDSCCATPTLFYCPGHNNNDDVSSVTDLATCNTDLLVYVYCAIYKTRVKASDTAAAAATRPGRQWKISCIFS